MKRESGLNRVLGVAVIVLFIATAFFVQPFQEGHERTVAAETVPSTVTEELVYRNTTIQQSQDITIEDGGELVLMNTTLKMMCDSSSTYKITVNSGGVFKLVEGSTLQANDDNYGYCIKINPGGTFIAEDSTIEDFISSGTDYLGFYIKSDSVDIINCTISSSDTYGIYIEDSSPRIVGCSFSTEEAIRVVGDSTPHIYDNQITGGSQGIYVKDNLERYTLQNTASWVGLTSGLKSVDNSYYTVDDNSDGNLELCDVALLAAGTAVAYSTAEFGIWGDNGNPHYEVGAALDGETAEDYATTTETTAQGAKAYFALNLQRERTIKKIELEYVNTNLGNWAIYYNSTAAVTPSYSPTLNSWQELADENDFTLNNGVYTCILSNPVKARHVLYVYNTGGNAVRPQIKRFSLYTDERMGILLTKPLSLSEGERWGRVYIDRDISENSDMFVSVCRQEIENGEIIFIEGYEDLGATELDLTDLDPIKYPEIMLRIVFLTSENDNPRLYGITLTKERVLLKEVEWVDEESNVEYIQNAAVEPGEVHINSTGTYYVDTFDRKTPGNIDGQDGWSVMNTDGNTYAQVVSDVFKGGGQALKFWDSSGDVNLKCSKDFGEGIGTGTIEFWWRIDDVSANSDSNDGYYLKFKSSVGGTTNGIILKYVGQNSSVSSASDVNYLEYYSSSGWKRIEDDFQMNRSRWYHFRIEFDGTLDEFRVWVNGEEVGGAYHAAEITTIDYVEITSSAAGLSYKCYLDEIHIYSGEFSTGVSYATLKSTKIREGERVAKVYVECFNLNDTLSVTVEARDNKTNILLDEVLVRGNVAEFNSVVSDNGTEGVYFTLVLKSEEGKYTPEVKRIWIEYQRVVEENEIRNSAKGLTIENADGYNVRNNDIVGSTEKGLWIKDCVGSVYGNRVYNGPSGGYGLYVENSKIVLNGINLTNNSQTFYCTGSTVYLENAIVKYAGATGFSAYSGSVIYAVDPDYSVLNSTVDSTSEIRIAHTLSVSVSGYPVSVWSENRGAEENDTTPPLFDGVRNVSSVAEVPYLILQWDPASDISEPILYNVYIALESGKQNFSSPNYTTNKTVLAIGPLKPETTYFIVVRAVDSAGNEDNNTIEKSAKTSNAIPLPPPNSNSHENGSNEKLIAIIILIIIGVAYILIFIAIQRKKLRRKKVL